MAPLILLRYGPCQLRVVKVMSERLQPLSEGVLYFVVENRQRVAGLHIYLESQVSEVMAFNLEVSP